MQNIASWFRSGHNKKIHFKIFKWQSADQGCLPG